jgi:hypothetical protein
MAPTNPARRALVLGDGDFSYSARLSGLGNVIVTATTIELEAELEKRYPTTFLNHRQKVKQHGGQCLFGIDARKLNCDGMPYVQFRGSFDMVVWHNPYTDGAELRSHRTLVARKVHKRLVADFIAAAPAVLWDDGLLVISINPTSNLIGETFLLDHSLQSGFVRLRDYPFEENRAHQYVLRYGDARDLAKRRRTYTKRSIRTYEFSRSLIETQPHVPIVSNSNAQIREQHAALSSVPGTKAVCCSWKLRFLLVFAAGCVWWYLQQRYATKS